ncbi:hypothetical protein Hanom_Chr11g00985041 [Helianthus anomalus]
MSTPVVENLEGFRQQSHGHRTHIVIGNIAPGVLGTICGPIESDEQSTPSQQFDF